MPTVAEVADLVIGADTHTDTHALVACAPSGAVLAELTIENDCGGFAEAVEWATALATGPRLVFGIEGTRAHGQGLAQFLTRAGLEVTEVERPSRATAARRGKSDPIDARAAAHATLRMDATHLAAPRADGDREALRILQVTRRGWVDEQKKAGARLRALLLGGQDTDRALLRAGTLSARTLTALTRRRPRKGEDRADTLRRREITRLARQVLDLNTALRANKRELTDLVDDMAPGLLAEQGVGPVSAAQLIVSFSHPGRVRNEAAFAAMGGIAPIQASSGRRQRHRLSRAGDRQLNRALHDIAKTRMRDCTTTRAYVHRRTTTTPNFTDRDARRCLKRYIARDLYKLLNKIMTPPPTPASADHHHTGPATANIVTP